MSRLIDPISRLFHPRPETSSSSIIVVTVLTTFAAITISRLAFRAKKIKIIKSPAATLLPRLGQAEKDALPYPLDALPGGRDVGSPYGTIRVFEWGPEDGRKVLLVHGITTPCLALSTVAHGLVERGCRVMLFDLWGRGYSDSCGDLEHDERLYSTQILLVITSSSLSWTGGPNGGFSLIGYSLGGGISVCFAGYFPAMVKSLVLLTPTGLIRPSRMGEQKKLLFFASLVPNNIFEKFIRRRLRRPMFPNENKDSIDHMAEAVGEAEFEDSEDPKHHLAPVSEIPPIMRDEVMRWHIGTHDGFYNSFMSSVRYGPVSGQQAAWKRLGLRQDKTLVIVATHDPIINAEELMVDAQELLGSEKIEWKIIDGFHNIPTTDSEKIVNEICGFWGM